MALDRNSHTSRLILWMQIPLAVIVAWHHFGTEKPGPEFYQEFLWAMSRFVVAEQTVPIFYLFSGYLLFFGRGQFRARDYFGVLRKKSVSLLLVYVIWCAILLLARASCNGPDALPSNWEELWLQFTGPDDERPIYTAFRTEVWQFGYPRMAFPLWFFRNLIVMVALSPLVWIFCKLPGRLAYAVITAMILLNAGVPGIGCETPAWFTMGALFAVKRFDFVRFCHRHITPIVIVWLLSSVLCCLGYAHFDYIHFTTGPKMIMLHYFTVYIGAFAMLGIASRILFGARNAFDALADGEFPECIGTRLNRTLMTLAPMGFFIYMIHTSAWFDPTVERFVLSFFPGSWHTAALFFAVAPVGIAAIVLVYLALRHFAPRTLAFITGGRSAKSFQSRKKLLTLRSGRV